MTQKNVGFVGTGFIAEIHAEAISKLPGHKLVAVADQNHKAAESFAQRWDAEHTFSDASELAKCDFLDAVHILTPPGSHAALGALFAKAGIPVFIEKPVGTSADELEQLRQAQEQSGTYIGVNQNSLFHPAFSELRDILGSGDIGHPVSVQCHYAAPLRQLESGQFSHWMFAEPINILLEQAVHPLAQIMDVTGAFSTVETLTAPPLEIGDGKPFYPTTLLNLIGSKASAQLHYSVGATYPRWEITVLCSDGSVTADIISNRVMTQKRTQWLEASDQASIGRSLAKQIRSQANRNFVQYAKSMIGLGGRADSFYVGMAGSIADFYKALGSNENGRATLEFGTALVEACLNAAEKMPAGDVKSERKSEPRDTVDVVLLGGTGFIGRYVTEKCVANGLTVRAVARNLANLPAVFSHENVDLVSADMRDAEAAKKVVTGTRCVVNLAHGGGGATRDAVLSAMLGSAEAVYNACRDAGVERLIHIGSIAGLYLGDASETITGSTPPDPQPEKRADYGMAKALTDLRMLELSGDGPEVTILRPGIVVGKGTPAAHSGLGVFNNDQHCLGWSDGTVKLPFVLVDDVASAVYQSLSADGIGGKCFNICGDVELTALEYFDELKRATNRPFQYHAQSPTYITFIENLKVLIKKIAGKKQTFHSLRDFKSRAMFAKFDCSDAVEALSWSPTNDRTAFIEKAIKVHATTNREDA